MRKISAVWPCFLVLSSITFFNTPAPAQSTTHVAPDPIELPLQAPATAASLRSVGFGSLDRILDVRDGSKLHVEQFAPHPLHFAYVYILDDVAGL